MRTTQFRGRPDRGGPWYAVKCQYLENPLANYLTEFRLDMPGRDIVKAMVAEGNVKATNSALNGADDLGLTFDDRCNVINGLKNSDFFKSMTTYNDHTVWQDVYCPKLQSGDVYLKLTVSNGVLIVSFKEK